MQVIALCKSQVQAMLTVFDYFGSAGQLINDDWFTKKIGLEGSNAKII